MWVWLFSRASRAKVTRTHHGILVLWETGKHNCMCQDNTGTLIWRLIRKKRTGCAKRAACETACGGNRRFDHDGHQSVSVTGGCVPRTCYGSFFWNVVWWNEIKWIIICKDSLLWTVPVHHRRTTFSASRVPEPPFGVGCAKLVWKHHAPTLQIRRG